jgi:CRISPR system Cascade subunit CasE
MYLSRIILPLVDRRAQELLGKPYELHRALMSAFPFPAGRVLFRVEPLDDSSTAGRAVVLVQSLDKPKWNSRQLPEGAMAEVKELKLHLEKGQRLRFRLRANPTKRSKPEDAAVEAQRSGQRLGLLTEESQQAWIVRKGESGGFKVVSVIIIQEDDPKSMSKGRKTVEGKEHEMSLLAVRYEGVLEVSDPRRLLETLQAGIGSGKGLGFGLLSLAPATVG